MSKQQAILETLLGTAELKGNQTIAQSIRGVLLKMSDTRQADGYQRLARAAGEIKRPRCKAA